MRNIRKSIKICIVFLVVIIVVFAVVWNTTYIKYDIKYHGVIGESYDEIIYKHGEFDVQFGYECGYKIKESLIDGIFRHYMGGTTVQYYYIVFDKNGIAQSTYKGADIREIV